MVPEVRIVSPMGCLRFRGITAGCGRVAPRAKRQTSPRKYFGKKWNYRTSDGLTARIKRKTREDTLKKILIVGALAFAATSIAQTASAAEFYVVRDATTKKCTIVDTKPTTTTTTVVDNGTFKTKTEAETGMKTMKVCTTN
jgi:hypothetical protein